MFSDDCFWHLYTIHELLSRHHKHHMYFWMFCSFFFLNFNLSLSLHTMLVSKNSGHWLFWASFTQTNVLGVQKGAIWSDRQLTFGIHKPKDEHQEPFWDEESMSQHSDNMDPQSPQSTGWKGKRNSDLIKLNRHVCFFSTNYLYSQTLHFYHLKWSY